MNNHIIDELFHKSKHPNRELYELYKQKKITIKDINGLIQSQIINPNNIWIKKIIKIEKEKIKQIKSLKDIFSVGPIEIWYSRQMKEIKKNWMIWEYNIQLGKSLKFPKNKQHLRKSHVRLGNVNMTKNQIFHNMQGEIWSPNGEARQFIKNKGLNHISMSVGDIVFDQRTEESWIVKGIGWKKIIIKKDKKVIKGKIIKKEKKFKTFDDFFNWFKYNVAKELKLAYGHDYRENINYDINENYIEIFMKYDLNKALLYIKRNNIKVKVIQMKNTNYAIYLI